jgi:DNA-binding NarL/FixJ family response regulator
VFQTEKISVMLNSELLVPVFNNREIFKLTCSSFDTPQCDLAVECARHLQPDAIIYKMDEAEEIPGQLIIELKKICPFSATIVLASSNKTEDIHAAVNAGADSYLLYESMSPSEISDAVELICEAKICFFQQAISSNEPTT